MEKTKCLIIGSGPAGYTAAIYAARANLRPILYTGYQPGGQLITTTEIENFPGYPNGIDGSDMMLDFEEQAKNMGADIRYGLVTKLEIGNPYKVQVDNDIWIEAETIIIATGASAKYLNIGEEKFNGVGVSACAVCDGFFYKDKEVIIVGGGDTAAEEALYLSNICSTVHMLVRSDKMRASKIMQDRVLSKDNIKIYWNTEAKEVIGYNYVTGAKLITNGEEYELNVSAFFIAIGHTPNSEIFKEILELDDEGYIITKPNSTKTSVEGIFACGDIQDKIFRQAITAAASGCMAALEAERYLN